MNVTFFGHRDASETLRPSLENVLIRLIHEHESIHFYIGNQGNFDALAKRILTQLLSTFPHIEVSTVLAYMPTKNHTEETNSLYPDGMEFVPRRFAIYKRNEWMLHQADIIVTHVISPVGGAAHFKAKAERMGKTVINIKK